MTPRRYPQTILEVDISFAPITKGEAMRKLKNAHACISIEDLETALKGIAQVIKLYGDVYLPIFCRIHEELNKAREDRDIRDIAMRLAANYAE